MGMAFISGMFGDFADWHMCSKQQLLSSLYAGVVQVFSQCQPCYLLEHAAEIVRADIELFGDFGQAQLLLIVLADVLDDLMDGVVDWIKVMKVIGGKVKIELIGKQQKFNKENLLVQVLIGMLLDVFRDHFRQ